MKATQGNVSRRGFTLIELLIVIAIILILVGLLLPAIGRARRRAELTKARQEIAQLEIALKAYLDEYRRPFGDIVGYPNWPGDDDAVEYTINGIEVIAGVVDMLRGENITDTQGRDTNRKQIPFFEVPEGRLSEEGEFIDPWRNPYKFMLDYDGSNGVHIAFTDFNGETNVASDVAVWSRGPNGSDESTDGEWDDDVRSWE